MTLDAVLQQGLADPDRVAWFGMSMGTAYGIPLCATETRLKAAAIGMWGTDWGQETSLLDNARRMRTPTLFQIKAEDEIFSTDGQRELFDALGSPNKCLHTFPGGHSLTAPGQLDELLDFIARALANDREGN
jgi:dienelactone hydrolase